MIYAATKIEPARAVSIALSVALGDMRFSERHRAVQLVLHAIEKAGWKIVPCEKES